MTSSSGQASGAGWADGSSGQASGAGWTDESSEERASEEGSPRPQRAGSAARAHIFGVRHHGPGSARAVVAALAELQPDIVLVEGPADADALVPLVGSPALVPPVAILGYAVDAPAQSAFWPFAVFSPEWQALRWATEHGVPVRFIDLPAGVTLALAAQAEQGGGDSAEADDEGDDGAPEAGRSGPDPGAETFPARPVDTVREDPIAVLASAAGYDDPERWWDDVVETRHHHASPAAAPFEVVAEAMAFLRQGREAAATTPDPGPRQLHEQRREAHMRQVLREVLKSGAERIAVVCGAWHAPALTLPLPPASRDAAVLRGIPKTKAALTWVPWTHGRLSFRSGYGAGVESPGWYAHLFSTTERPVADWLTRVAAALREQDLPVSSAHVIEAVRLAETLAVLRGRPLPGLSEIQDATLAVICEGNPVTLDLVTRHLVVGEALGEVPEDAPTVPLEADLAAQCRRLRIKREPTPSGKELDLRKETDLARSQLWHRLQLLGIRWATTDVSHRGTLGTFKETWALRWQPELAVAVVEASLWGTTVESAAVTRICSDALAAPLPLLTRLVEKALLAGLDEALPDLLVALDRRAARDHDIDHLMAALPPLARVRRYGDVRGTDLSSLATVIDSLLVRICAGLSATAGGLDDDGAEALRQHLDAVSGAVALLDEADQATRWHDALSSLVGRADVHGLVQGRITRLLLDAGRITPQQAGDRVARALSVGSEPGAKAAWVEGFLAGGGLLLVHDRALLALLDDWVCRLGEQEFIDVAPLLRRTFGQLAGPERRSIGESVRRLDGSAGRPTESAGGWDHERAAPAVTRVAALLGLAPLTAAGPPPAADPRPGAGGIPTRGGR